MKRFDGFTIVELLVVIVVIGILAAITLVSYGNIQNMAADSAVQSELNQGYKKGAIAGVEDSVLDPGDADNRQATLDWLDENIQPSIGNYKLDEEYPLVAMPHYSYGSSRYEGYDIAAVSRSGKVFIVSFDKGGVAAQTTIDDWQSMEEYLTGRINEMTAYIDQPENDCVDGQWNWCEDELEWLRGSLDRVLARQDEWSVGRTSGCSAGGTSTALGSTEYAFKRSAGRWIEIRSESTVPVDVFCGVT